MRVLLVFIIISFGFIFSAFAEPLTEDNAESCIELEEIILDLQGRLFDMESQMKMEVYPSCTGNIASAASNDYCSMETNLSFILQSYNDKCE